MVFALHADRLLPDYDTGRARTVGPLCIVPEVKIVVLGLVSTKRPELQVRDQLRRRLDAGRGICSQAAARPQVRNAVLLRVFEAIPSVEMPVAQTRVGIIGCCRNPGGIIASI